MAFSKSLRQHDSSDNKDLISNLPTVLSNKILKRLPLPEAAKMSFLSRQWRHNLYSFGYLVFDRPFLRGHYDWKLGELGNWQKMSGIISNILFHQKGPIYKFHLDMVLKNFVESKQVTISISQWLSFLSRIGVKKIHLYFSILKSQSIPSLIFACEQLEKLRIQSFILVPPPSDFKGFEFLRNLELVDVEVKDDTFNHLIASCPRLLVLTAVNCTGLCNLIIDAPSLEHLTIKTRVTKSIALKNVQRVNHASLNFDRHAIKFFGSLCQLQYLCIAGRKLFKLLGARATEFIEFSHLQKLCLEDFELDDFEEFCFFYDIIQSCHFIKDLCITMRFPMSNENFDHSFEFNENHKLGHLQKVKIEGIIGSCVELKVIEYVLSISPVLEELLLKSTRMCA